MDRQLCVLHANCQGEPMAALLRLCPGFAARYEIRLFTNYTREPVPDEVLSSCSLFLFQHLGPQWNGLASEALLKKNPAQRGRALRAEHVLPGLLAALAQRAGIRLP